jgi:hypothetical protein
MSLRLSMDTRRSRRRLGKHGHCNDIADRVFCCGATVSACEFDGSVDFVSIVLWGFHGRADDGLSLAGPG